MIFGGAIARTLGTMWRKCPKCGARQEVPFLKKSKTITCRYCGASVDASHNEPKARERD